MQNYSTDPSPSSPSSLKHDDHRVCEGLKKKHVSVLVKRTSWIPDNLDNLYSCPCGLTCLWTKSPVLADQPDAHLFEKAKPPLKVCIYV